MDMQQRLFRKFILLVIENKADRLVVVIDHLLAVRSGRDRLSQHLFSDLTSRCCTFHLTGSDRFLHIGANKIAILVRFGNKTLRSHIAAEIHIELVALPLHGIGYIKPETITTDFQYSAEHAR